MTEKLLFSLCCSGIFGLDSRSVSTAKSTHPAGKLDWGSSSATSAFQLCDFGHILWLPGASVFTYVNADSYDSTCCIGNTIQIQACVCVRTQVCTSMCMAGGDYLCGPGYFLSCPSSVFLPLEVPGKEEREM